MNITNNKILTKFSIYYLLFLLVGYFYFIFDFIIKYSTLWEKDFPFWFYLNLYIHNSCWIIVTLLIYISIPTCIFFAKNFLLKNNEHSTGENGLSFIYFSKPLIISGALLMITQFLLINFILPDANFNVRSYFIHIKSNEHFDEPELKKLLKSKWRTDREKNYVLTKNDYKDIQIRINNIVNIENKKYDSEMLITLKQRMRNIKIKMYSFFIYPFYLFSIFIFMIPVSFLIKNLHKILLLIISLFLVFVFYALTIETENLVENLDFHISLLLLPILFILLIGIILIIYLNRKYKVYIVKG